MNKTYLTGASMLAVLSSAFAQAPGAAVPSAVVIYGVVDAAVERINKVGPEGANLTRMPTNTASAPSRWGLRGSEDLGGGLRAVFTLEAGFGTDNGAPGQGGRAFGRQAFVGLAGPWGTVSLGRQYTMTFWSLLDADILGPHLYGSGSMDAYLPNARADNSIAWRGTFNGLTLGANYSLGRDVTNAGPSPAGTNCPGEVAGDSTVCRQWSVLAKYDTPQWGVAAVLDRQHGGPGAFAGLTSGSLRDTRSMVNGWFKAGPVKVGGGLLRRENEGSPLPRSDLAFVGAAYALTPTITIDGELFRLDVKNSPSRATLGAVRATYQFSRRTAAYVTAGHINNRGTLAVSVSAGQPGGAPAPGGSQTGIAAGLRHTF
jgi:predicted porin